MIYEAHLGGLNRILVDGLLRPLQVAAGRRVADHAHRVVRAGGDAATFLAAAPGPAGASVGHAYLDEDFGGFE